MVSSSAQLEPGDGFAMKLDGGATAGEIAQHDGWHTGVRLLGWSNLVVVVEVGEDAGGQKRLLKSCQKTSRAKSSVLDL